MSQHDSLRERTEQHKVKNMFSKNDDKSIAIASKMVINYIQTRFNFIIKENNYTFDYSDSISLGEIAKFIQRKGMRKDFDFSYSDRCLRPDGGIIYLITTDGDKLPLVISEVKRQGTNNERLQEGKKKQAVGNAIERLGKNLIGVRTMMQYEDIVPFVCFGWGCDFGKDESAKTVLAKVSTMNELYPLNKIHVRKKDGLHGVNSAGFSPVSMFFREEEWTVEEMYNIMKEIAETSFRYYTT